MTEYVCDRCGATATFERRSVAVWEGEVPVGNALVLACSECGVLHEVLSGPTGN
jgi:DNA-directed RNA polymerase subunit RPC12/RpoP